LVAAQVVKRHQKGRVVTVEIRPIFGQGTWAAVLDALGWKQAHLSAIERFNLTDRCRNRRKGRKTLAFSKRVRFHDWMSFISALRDTFRPAHRALRRPTDDGHWERRTPAMAAGLVEHRYSTLELLRVMSGWAGIISAHYPRSYSKIRLRLLSSPLTNDYEWWVISLDILRAGIEIYRQNGSISRRKRT
jgi:hypothetical protein